MQVVPALHGKVMRPNVVLSSVSSCLGDSNCPCPALSLHLHLAPCPFLLTPQGGVRAKEIPTTQ